MSSSRSRVTEQGSHPGTGTLLGREVHRSTSVRLRVVHQSEAQLGSQLRTEFSESGVVKLFAVVNSDLLQDTEAAYNILPENFLQHCSYNISKSLGFDLF